MIRKFRFRLWHLLIAITVCALLMASVMAMRKRVADEQLAIHESQMLRASVSHSPVDESKWNAIKSWVAGGPVESQVKLRFEELDESWSMGPYGPEGAGVQLLPWNEQNIESLEGILPRLSGLVTLSFRDSPLPRGMLVKILPPCELNYLNLEGTQIGAEDIAALRRVPSLQILNLSNTDVTDEDLDYVAGLADLSGLRLENTRVTDVGIRKLAHLDRLEKVDLGLTKVTPAMLPVLISWQVKTQVLLPAEWNRKDVEQLKSESPTSCRVRRSAYEFRFKPDAKALTDQVQK